MYKSALLLAIQVTTSPTSRPQLLPTSRPQFLPTSRPQFLQTSRPQLLPTSRPQLHRHLGHNFYQRQGHHFYRRQDHNFYRRQDHNFYRLSQFISYADFISIQKCTAVHYFLSFRLKFQNCKSSISAFNCKILLGYIYYRSRFSR